ncbi:MAG: serine/threonine protein kinase, partial [Candidatus Eremiobacteraeota bacterium]|nr:serine/threonine protein kinase [Candidatus Eremiobacteraeota bacterium]
MSLAEGTVLADRYRIIERIGSGGMGEVYRGYDHGLERDVAIKVLAEHSDDVNRRFLAEAQAMARLNHPSIVAVYDVGVEGPVSYIIMEYVRGATIREIDRRTCTIAHAVDLVAQLVRALEFAHEHDVVHRDIKPGNVIVSDDGVVKVTDFGLARRMSDVGNMSQSSEIVGTVAYLPPERFMGKTGGRSSDLYSVGVLLYELATGALPFAESSEDLVSTMIAHVNEVPRPPRLLNPKIPAELDRIIARLLESEPQRRFTDAGALLAALESARVHGGSGWASTLPAAAPPAQAPSRSAYAEALALVERGMAAGRGGDGDAAERAYRQAIDLIAQRGA